METKCIEYKITLDKNNPLQWLKTLCGFANTLGGQIFVGYNDNGDFVGMTHKEADQLVRYVNHFVKQHTSPMVQYKFKYDKRDNKIGVIIDVSRRNNAITWLVDSAISPQMYIRVEGETVLASVEEMELALMRSNLYEYDKTPTGISGEDVSFDELSEEYRKNNDDETLTTKMLKSFELITHDNSLTIAGYVFCDNSDYKNMQVVCTTWPGNDRGTDAYADSKNFHGSAISLINSTINYIKNVGYYRFGGQKEGMYRKDIGSFSISSLREAMVNAIAHRDYKINGNEISVNCYPNRIEITSPGSMVQNGQTVTNAKLESIVSVRRNKVICDTFVKCKLMEEKGSGFDKIINDYSQLDENYFPRYCANRISFTLILKNKKYDFGLTALSTTLINYPKTGMFESREELYKRNNRFKEIELLISAHPNITYVQLADELGLTRDGIKYNINKMKEDCLIRRVGNSVSGQYVIVNDLDRPAYFHVLDADIKVKIVRWCQTQFVATKTFNKAYTSYGLKHILERQDNTYLTNGQFKAAMLLAGFLCEDINELNWHFNISKRSPALILPN